MLYEVIVSSLLRSPIMGCECGQIHGMLRNLVCCRSVFHRLVHHGALGQEVGSNGESCTALASRTRCRGGSYYVALQDMKTLKNQAKKKYHLLVMLLLQKVCIFAQNIYYIKITASSTRTSGYLPFMSIIDNNSFGEQYVKTFPKNTFPSNLACF